MRDGFDSHDLLPARHACDRRPFHAPARAWRRARGGVPRLFGSDGCDI